MKKLLAFILIILVSSQSFAYNLLQDAPPPPTPFDLPGVPEDTPINFIIPFLLISGALLTLYVLKKNKMKTIS